MTQTYYVLILFEKLHYKHVEIPCSEHTIMHTVASAV